MVHEILMILQISWVLAAVVLTLVSQEKLLSDTGENGGKILIPFYGHYLFYKRTSNGGTIYLLCVAFSVLAAFFCIVFPFMGYVYCAAPVICLLFLSIVVAQAYKKSPLFALGLFLLPMIFYFSLAFDGQESKEKLPAVV